MAIRAKEFERNEGERDGDYLRRVSPTVIATARAYWLKRGMQVPDMHELNAKVRISCDTYLVFGAVILQGGEEYPVCILPRIEGESTVDSGQAHGPTIVIATAIAFCLLEPYLQIDFTCDEQAFIVREGTLREFKGDVILEG